MRIRSRLVLLSFGTLIPVLAFCVFMLVAFNRQTRAATEQGLVETARALSVAVDQNMSASILVLEALATSEHLQAGHLKDFHLTARTVLATQPNWQSILLYSPDGRQLMNTSQPAGIPLPLSGNPEMMGQVARTRVPLVSDLFMGRTRHQPLVLAVVPIVRDGAAVYLLGASIDPKTLTDLLSLQKVPPDTIGTLLDRNKVIIARTQAADRFVGQHGTSDLAAKMDETEEGAFRLFTKDGEPVYAAISRSPRTGWTIALGVPQRAADAPLRRALWLLLLVGGSTTLLGVGLAVLGARGIAKPIASLSTAAAALVRGGRIEAGSSALSEVNDVTLAMEQAGEERRRHEAAAAALAAVGRDLTGTLDLTQVTGRTVSAVLDLFRVRGALLYQVNDAADGLICVAAAGEPDPHKWLGRPLGKGEGVAGLAFAERRLVSSADITSDPTVTLPRWAHEQSRADGYEAVTGVPLIVRGRVLGVLALGDLAGRVFTDEELRLLTAFADQVAIAFENARLNQETEERLARSETLLSVGSQVSGMLDVTEMMRRVARETCRALRAEMVGVFLADPDHAYLRPIAGYHVPHHLLNAFLECSLPLKGHRLLEEAWKQGKPVAVSDVAADPRVDPEVLRLFPVRSSLFCPMVVQGELIGGLFVSWLEHEHQFTPAELRLADGISRQAGIAVANARLVEELKTRQSRLEALLRVGRELSRIQAVESLLGGIAEISGPLFDASAVAFHLVEGDDLVLCGQWGQSSDLQASPRLKIERSLTGSVVTTRDLLLVDDPASDPRLAEGSRESYREQGVRAFLGVPVTIDDKVIGVLAVRTCRSNGFSPADVELARALASQAAVALENSRLYEEVRRAFNELSETRDQLVQAQKMEAVGQLAGGIAHDFNNILTVIGGRSQLLLARTAADDPVRPHVELIAKASDRAAALTRQLLAFSRKQVLEPKVLDLNALVGGLATMLRRLIGEHIELLVVPGADLEQVLADPGQLEQVIMNLAVNARDAMPEGGMVKIETAALDLPGGVRHAQGQIPPGHYAALIVQDTGCGINSATLTRVFEPFFTTKESGKGTGLGLSTVYGIVHQSGGFIGVDSTVGQGSTFTIYLPRTASPAEAVEASPLTGPTPRGRETILLVEDDDGIRGLISDVLKASGYTVLETGDPLEATVIGDRHPGPVHLLFTDIVMPAMQGPALAAELRAVRPEIGLLYMTGYTDGTIVTRDTIEPPGAFLQKPFLPNVLLRVVRDALDAGPKRSGRSKEYLHA